MGKVSCSKSSNVYMKPTSYCRTVENMLIFCNRYIIIRNKSAKNMEQVFQDVTPYEYKKQFYRN